MTLLTWIEMGRIFNAAVSGFDLVMLLLTIRNWSRRSPGNRFLWSGLAVILAATSYGNIETLAQGTKGGIRIALFSVALVYVAAGLISKKRGNWNEDLPERDGRL